MADPERRTLKEITIVASGGFLGLLVLGLTDLALLSLVIAGSTYGLDKILNNFNKKKQ